MATQKNNQSDTATSFKLMAVLFIIFSVVAPTDSAHGFSEAQTSARSGSVRPDGKLDFVGLDGSKEVTIVIEIAETAEERRKGLMGRASLPMTNGMLFIFEQAELRYFWMYTTPVSLDMIFVDPEKRIVHIAESTLPMSTGTYGSQFPAQYAVEVPAGFVKFFKIKTGMRIQWQRR
ncbi:MAG: DUF192 domain-containing protein [Desulfobacterales bacterium]|nr:DUF192 domain-containing protein [Desulfobacterales bacterium]